MTLSLLFSSLPLDQLEPHRVVDAGSALVCLAAFRRISAASFNRANTPVQPSFFRNVLQNWSSYCFPAATAPTPITKRHSNTWRRWWQTKLKRKDTKKTDEWKNRPRFLGSWFHLCSLHFLAIHNKYETHTPTFTPKPKCAINTPPYISNL